MNYIYLKVNNNKVMCHPSMKLSDMFDPNPMCTSDKICGKAHFCERNALEVRVRCLPLSQVPKSLSFPRQCDSVCASSSS